MNIEREESSLVGKLTALNKKYTDSYCDSISKEDAEQAFRDLLTPFKFFYFSDNIIQYFEFICRISSRKSTNDEFMIPILEELLNSSDNLEDKLFYLDLILQLKTRLNISSSLSTETDNYIDSAIKPDSVERIVAIIPNKHNREGEIIGSDLDSLYLSLIEFLICLSMKIVDYHSNLEIQIYRKGLNTILDFIRKAS